MAVGMPTIRVLGPVEAEIDGTPVDLGGRQQRAVLARLLVARGEVVSVDRLIDDLWHGEPPPKATGALQAYVSNLRKALEPNRAPRTPATVLISRPPGYAILPQTALIDAGDFERALTSARELPPAQRVQSLRATLSLWRGDAFAEFAAEPWASSESARLNELRTMARETLVDALLRADDAAAAVLEAEGLVRDSPLRDEAWRLLSLSQYGAGRQADALATLREARRALADELGMDPGPELAVLETAILTHEVELPSKPTNLIAPARSTRSETDADHFVGRTNELRRIVEHAAATKPHRASVALISGEPGAGKSALLDRVGIELRRSNWRVAIGRCPELAGAQPAWAVAEVLRSLAAEVDPGQLAEPLAPLLLDVVPAPAGDAAEAQFRMHRAVSEWLGNVSDRPVAVLLDDIHRADNQTRLVISRLLEHGGPARVLLVLAYRLEPNQVLDDALADVAAYAPVRMELAGLDRDSAGALLEATAGGLVDEAVKQIVVERTGGNPFYLAETARLLASEGTHAAVSRVPMGVADVIRRRLARLPAASVIVLRLASVIGRTMDVTVLVEASAQSEPEVLDAIEAGLISGLLVEEDDPRRVRFAHILIRETLYADIPGPRRVALHAAIALALERVSPNDIDALAHHSAEGATATSATRAAMYCTQAARQATRRFSHDTAAQLYERALRCLEIANAPTADRISIMTELVPALVSAGFGERGLSMRNQLLPLAEQFGDAHRTAAAIASMNIANAWSHRVWVVPEPVALAVIERSLDSEELTAEERCLVLNAFVHELGDTADPRAIPAAEEALRLARKIDDPELIAMSLATMSDVTLPEFCPAARDSIRSELRVIAEQHSIALYEVLATVLDATSALVRLDLDGARTALQLARSLAEKCEIGHLLFVIGLYEAALAHVAGDIETARRLFAETFQRHGRDGGRDEFSPGLAAAAFALASSTGTLGELEPLTTMLKPPEGLNFAGGFAYVLVEAGQLDAARKLCPVMLDVPRNVLWSLLISSAGMALAAMGERELGKQAYDELLPHHDQLVGGSSAYICGPVARVLGKLAVMLDIPGDARAHFEEAAVIATRCGNPYWIRQIEADLAALDG